MLVWFFFVEDTSHEQCSGALDPLFLAIVYFKIREIGLDQAAEVC